MFMYLYHYNFSQTSNCTAQVHQDWLKVLARMCVYVCVCVCVCVSVCVCVCVRTHQYASSCAGQEILWFWKHMDSSHKYT